MKGQKDARGWILDQLIMIGHYEAQLSHIDEKLNDLWEVVNNETEDMEKMQKTTNTISTLYEIGRDVYAARKEAETQVFDAFPEADKTFWCMAKHSATAFVIAEENFHARNFDADSERVMLAAAANLGKVVGMALGFEPYGCLRCLSEATSLALSKQNEYNGEYAEQEGTTNESNVLDKGVFEALNDKEKKAISVQHTQNKNRKTR